MMKTGSVTLATALNIGAAAPTRADGYERTSSGGRSWRGCKIARKINRAEFRRIENAQNTQSRHICRQKHDRQSR